MEGDFNSFLFNNLLQYTGNQTKKTINASTDNFERVVKNYNSLNLTNSNYSF